MAVGVGRRCVASHDASACPALAPCARQIGAPRSPAAPGCRATTLPHEHRRSAAEAPRRHPSRILAAMDAERPRPSAPWRPVIGVVGGIGSGKSAVARAFAGLGCVVCHSDDLARAVLAEPEVVAAIRAALGDAVLAADGSIDRALLARAIFADPAARRAVESAMHPRIEARRRAAFAAAPDAAPAFVIDAPLLLEVGLDRECDAVVLVEVPRAERLARVAARGWDAAELDRREAAQLPLAEKTARATDRLANDGPIDALPARVAELLARIVARGPRHPRPDRAATPASGRSDA
ncbi:MAG: Dephospho-CoA kinase [Planctomycetota bacterium]